MKYIVLISCLFVLGNFYCQTSVEGKWITIDDNTKKPKSIIELKLVKGKLEGTILKIYPEKGQPENPLCDKCSDHRKNKPVIGMKVMQGLYRSGKEYKGGEILDPENGKIYSCKLWLEDGNPNKLNLRGYLGPFYRTQQWIKYDEK